MNTEVILTIFQSNFCVLLCIIFLGSFIAVDRTFDSLILNLFLVSLLHVFFLTVSDSIEYYHLRTLSNIPVRMISSSMSYIFRIGCITSIVCITQRKCIPHLFVISILFFINVFVALANIKTGCLYTINPDHTWTIGNLFSIPYIICGICGIFFIISIVKDFRTHPGEAVIVIGIIIICLTANLLELFLEVKFLLPKAFAISVVFYYLCLNVQLYKRDKLTDLLNRRSFYLDAKRWSKENLIIVSMDLNDLKKYNDTEGHAAGDLAICTSVKCMNNAFSKFGKVYRTGGDEFMALFKNKSEVKVLEAINIFQTNLSKTRYKVACGIAKYTPEDDFEEIVSKADSHMYSNKKILKTTVTPVE